LLGWYVAGRLVFEAVGFQDVVARPLVAAVVVVQVEEGAGVEAADVVFLWSSCGQSNAIKVVSFLLLLNYQPCVGSSSLRREILWAFGRASRAPVCRPRGPGRACMCLLLRAF
jgi:hypothetical protein